MFFPRGLLSRGLTSGHPYTLRRFWHEARPAARAVRRRYQEQYKNEGSNSNNNNNNNNSSSNNNITISDFVRFTVVCADVAVELRGFGCRKKKTLVAQSNSLIRICLRRGARVGARGSSMEVVGTLPANTQVNVGTYCHIYQSRVCLGQCTGVGRT